MSQLPSDLLLFDLDGTLVDSAPDIIIAVARTLHELHLPSREPALIRRWMGNGVTQLLHRALTGQMHGHCDDEALLEHAMELFEIHYANTNGCKSQVYDGVQVCLQYLAQTTVPMSCITNKPYRFATDLLCRTGLIHYFDLILGGDSLPCRKPDPAPLLHAAKFHHVIPDNTVMIGDSISDIKAARAAGCAAVCVTYGYNQGYDLSAAHPDALIETLATLPSLLMSAH